MRSLRRAGDWLNDGVRTYLSPNVEGFDQHHTFFLHTRTRQVYGALKRDPALAQACIDGEPPALAHADEHALLGAVGEHLARRWKLAIPGWADHPSRLLGKPHFTNDFDDFKAMMIAQSPLAFRRRLIFTEAEPLRRARMPRDPAPPPVR